jgi:2-polyprenyl-3-methyl-5-hydroxy-6-metoxy-1,4-benzoquinol methylase
MIDADDAPNPCYLCRGATARIEAGGLKYRKCESCGLIMRCDTYSGDQFIDDTYGHEYYENPESYPQWDSDPRLKDILNSRIERLQKLQPQRGRLLDVGTGLGHFMLAARSAGWDVVGVEPSPHARKIAQSRVGAMVYASVSDVHEGARFACVTLWDVLEHDVQPLDLLARLRDVMIPNGLLAVSMPNLAGLEARLRGRSWRYFRSEFGHMTHHTPNTLSLMLCRAGFEVTEVETEGSLNLSFRPEAVLSSSLVLDTAQRGIDRAVAWVGLGRNMTVYARSR